jgi:hypothetical protein
MNRSKPCFAFRPLVEYLESRLQPGSMIIGQGYGWSLLADNLSVLSQDKIAPSSLVSQASSASSRSATTNTPADVHSDALQIAVASVAAVRSTSLSTNNVANNSTSSPINNLVNDSLSAGLANDDLFSSPTTSHPSSQLLAAAATSSIQMPPPATPVGSVAQSPVGVAAPVQPIASASSGVAAPVNAHSTSAMHVAQSGIRGVSGQTLAMPTPTFRPITGLQIRNAVQASPIAVPNGVINTDSGGNQATINFLSYLGGGTTSLDPSFQGPGPDSINSVVVDNEGGANFIYVAGSITDATGRTDAFAAKLADGATSVVWIESLLFVGGTSGPDRATGLTVDANGVYVAGSFADPSAAQTQTDGFVAQLDPNAGTVLGSAVSPNVTLVAVTTDASGNVYVAGSTADTTNAGQIDPALLEYSSNLQSTLAPPFMMSFVSSAGDILNVAVATGSDLGIDSVGNVDFAGTRSILGDPTYDVQGFFGQVDPTLSTLNFARRIPNNDFSVSASGIPTPGPGGIITALAFDPNGNVFYTGAVNNTAGPSPTPLHQDFMIGHVNNPSTGAGVYGQWWVDNRVDGTRIGDWAGNGLIILPDESAIVVGAAYDQAAGTGLGDPASLPTKGVDVTITHFVSTTAGGVDSATTQNGDGDPENVFGGSGTDVGTALALDPTSSASPYNVYVVGSTTSTDLPTTSGVVQPTYAGSSTTGFVGQASVA